MIADLPLCADGSIDIAALDAVTTSPSFVCDAQDHGFEMMDVICVERNRTDSTPDIHFVFIWRKKDAPFFLDAIRIPWSGPKPPDPRNNPLGKNPTNFWKWEGQLPLFGDAEVTATSHMLRVIQRLVVGHSSHDEDVVWLANLQDVVPLDKLELKPTRVYISCVGAPARFSDNRVTAAGEWAGTDLESQVVERSMMHNGRQVRARVDFSDCRLGLSKLEADSVTHVITSPPYNIGYSPFNVERQAAGGKLVSARRLAYADSLDVTAYYELLQTAFTAVDRVASKSGFDCFINIKNSYSNAMCVPPFFLARLVPRSWRLAGLLIWRYDISYDPAVSKYKPTYEWVFWFKRGGQAKQPPVCIDFYLPILKGNSRERKNLRHPAMFPRELVHELLRRTNCEDAFVVDPFAGSGTTVAACLEAGVDAIGFEISEDFMSDAKNRLEWIARVEGLAGANE